MLSRAPESSYHCVIVVEHLLSPTILAVASLEGNEYAWRPAHVEDAINDARHRGLSTEGGQAQFRLAGATCEPWLGWLDVDPSDRKLGETWTKWVHRSADEAIAKFRRRMAETDWNAEIEHWKFLRERAASGVDVMSNLYFVLYFEQDPLGGSPQG